MLKPLIMTIKRLLERIALIAICVLVTQFAFSQTKVISGKITDAGGNPVQGATVSVKGSKSGTSTDASGNFKVTVPSATSTLVVSSVGYAKQEINVSSQSEVTVALVTTNANLNEIVVTGYATARRKDLTGAVASIQSKDFNKGVVTNPDQLLEGKVPGLQVINSNWSAGRCHCS